MKDFAKSIVCNTKAEAEKVGNFEDPKDAKRYIQMWERRKQDAKSWIDDANRKLRELHKDHGGAFGSLSESEKRSHKAEAQRHEDTIRKYQAEFEKYDNLIKQAQKSTWGNTKAGNAWVGVKKSNGTYMPVEEGFYYRINGKRVGVLEINGNQLKLSDGRTININNIKNIEAGNSKTGNIAADITTDGNTWFVTTSDGKKKEFPSEREAEEYVKKIKAGNKKTGNSRVGNKKIKGSYVTIDTSTGRVTFDDFAGKSFDISRIDSSAGYELRVMQQQINDFKKALEEAKSLAKQNGLI